RACHPPSRSHWSLFMSYPAIACFLLLLSGKNDPATNDKKEPQPSRFTVQFVDGTMPDALPRFTIVLTVGGRLRDIKGKELTDDELTAFLSADSGKDRSKPHIIRLFVSDAQGTSIEEFRSAIMRMRSNADPRIETRINVHYKDRD